jgi:hypothetical protein
MKRITTMKKNISRKRTVKNIKGTYKNKRNTKTRRRLRGGGQKEQKERIVKDNFRNMFMNSFNKLQASVKSGIMERVQKVPEIFNNGFKSNQIGINTLIPITNGSIPINRYNYKQDVNPLIAFVPLLVVIFDNIDDFIIRKIFIKNFIENKGNINLLSYTQNISALSAAIKLQDKELVKYLLKPEIGADINLLTEDQKDLLEILIKDEEIEAIIEPEPLKPVVKLTLPTELPSDSGYNPEVEPEFWKQIFAENEMLIIRNKINEMMNSDGNILIKTDKEIDTLWSICAINHAMIPTYFTPTKNEPYDSFGSLMMDQDIDFSHYNIVLCAALIVFGIISEKMVGQDYKLIFKGGRAIQLVLAGIPESPVYKTEDIDVLIMPDTDIPYNETVVKNLSGHLAYLIRWFLNTTETQYKISVQVPNPLNTRANPFIFKLSYLKVTQKRDYRKGIMVDDFKQFSDIDFKETPTNVKPYFENSVAYKFFISELDQTVLFRCPNIGSLLNEKLYYYSKYFQFKKMLEERTPITEEGYEKLTVMECDRFMEKFERAILAMNKGLQKQRFSELPKDELLKKEISFIETRLEKLGIKDETLVTDIVEKLYKTNINPDKPAIQIQIQT